jgi:hypothetical protein
MRADLAIPIDLSDAKGEQLFASATVIAPDVALLGERPIVWFALPGGGYNGRYFDLCVQGRLLILSHPAATVHGDTPLTRETCLALNAACAHIAEKQTTEDDP